MVIFVISGTPLGQWHSKVVISGKTGKQGFNKNMKNTEIPDFKHGRIKPKSESAANNRHSGKTVKTDRFKPDWPKGQREMTVLDMFYDTTRGNTFRRLEQ